MQPAYQPNPNIPRFGDAQKSAPKPIMKDAPWVLISFAVWITSAVLYHKWRSNQPYSNDSNLADNGYIKALVTSTLIASVFGFVWLGVMRVLKRSIVWISLLALPVLYVCLGLWAMSNDTSPVGFFMVAAFMALWAWIRRDRIPFVTAMLAAATESLVDLPGLLAIQVVVVLLNIGWAIFFVFFSVAAIDGMPIETYNDWIHFFIVTWGLYTLCTALNSYTSHVIACGAVAAWWLTPNDLSPICNTTQRTLRYSFGTISLGAFLVTIFEVVRMVLAIFFDNWLLRVCWRCLERVFRLFSSYAFVRVAVFGESFCEAAKHTADMFASSGLDALTNDVFMWTVVRLGAWLLGAVHGFITIIIFKAYFDVSDDYLYYGYWCIGLLIGHAMVLATTQPIESAIRTTFVLWSEPGTDAKMSANRPQLFGAILSAAQTHPGFKGRSAQTQGGYRPLL